MRNDCRKDTTHDEVLVRVVYGAGELGESVYGEKADVRPLFGDGSKGDLSAIIL